MFAQSSGIFTDQVLLNPPEEVFRDTTVLSRAIKTGTIKEVKILLERGCDPNLSCGLWGMRPLMIAQYITNEKRKQQIVQLLIQFGAVPSLADNHQRNCLMYACALRSCESVSSMLQAAEYDFYATDCDGNSVLHLCAMVGDADILKVVLKHAYRYRCNLNSRNRFSLTALMVAIMRQRKECTKMLHEHGAIPRFTSSDFQSVLSIMEGRSDSSDVCDSEGVNDDLLLRILSDSESVCGQLDHEDQSGQSNLPHISTKGHCLSQYCVRPCSLQPLTSHLAIDEDQSLQCSQDDQRTIVLAHSSPYTNHQKDRSHRPYTCCSLKSKLASQCLDMSLPQSSSQESPSYMATIEELLTRSYPIRKSSSYSSPPAVKKHDINTKWVDTIRKYHYDEQNKCTCDTVPVERPSLRLARTISSPSDGGLHQTCNTYRPSSTSRPKSLSRSTTSPHFFSVSRKPVACSPDGSNTCVDNQE